MKKLLFTLFLFCSLFAQAQFTKPAGVTPITGYTLFYNPSDSTFTICWSNPQKCNTFVQHFDTVKLSGWVNNRKLKIAIDSVRNNMYSGKYEIEVSTTGVSTYSVPVALKTKTMVFYNGCLVRSNLWSGIGTTSLVIGLQTDIRDYITIQY